MKINNTPGKTEVQFALQNLKGIQKSVASDHSESKCACEIENRKAAQKHIIEALRSSKSSHLPSYKHPTDPFLPS